MEAVFSPWFNKQMIIKPRVLIWNWSIPIMLSILSCETQPFEPTQPIPNPYDPTPVELFYPKWFPTMPVSETNPLTEEGIELGRRLYYDPILHPNGNMSCSSCHDQNKSFTVSTTGTAVLAHINLGWSNNFLWNGKVQGTMEDIMQFEVNEFFETDIERLKSHPEYQESFYEAFGEPEITTELCAMALSQYFRSMISANSRFDRYYPGKIQPTQSEVAGYDIFNSEKGDCFHCHPQPLFTDNQFHNIGLDDAFTSENWGRYEVTGSEFDKGLFKTPTLRNVSLTGPYMHDGRFQTLEEVINHYDHGVLHSNTLDPIMSKSDKLTGLNLSDEDKANLLAFLLSLTDSTYISNPDFSQP
jgi:cytochrome c peroxidase